MTSPFRELTISDVERINAKNRPRVVHRADMDAVPNKIRDSLPKSKERAALRAREKEIRISEHQHQTAVVQWWDAWSLTVGLDHRLLFAVPNGAYKSGAQAVKFRREGLRAGVPDLILALPFKDRTFCGMFIELKSENGRIRPEQAAYADVLRDAGYNCITAYGADEAIRAIKVYVERAKS